MMSTPPPPTIHTHNLTLYLFCKFAVEINYRHVCIRIREGTLSMPMLNTIYPITTNNLCDEAIAIEEGLPTV